MLTGSLDGWIEGANREAKSSLKTGTEISVNTGYHFGVNEGRV